MPKNALPRLIFSLLLVLLIILPSCETGEPTDTDTTAATQVAAETQAAFSITDKYVLVRPEAGSNEEIAAMQYIKRGLDSIFGVMLQVKTDWVKRGAEIVPGEFEILIGPTNRPQSQAAKAALGSLDYCYEIVSENVIVICGGSPDKTLEAARRFCSIFSGMRSRRLHLSNLAGAAWSFAWHLYVSRFDYPVDTLKISFGHTIRWCPLAVKTTKLIVSAISSLWTQHSVVKRDYAGGPVIFVGCADGRGLKFDSHTYYNRHGRQYNRRHDCRGRLGGARRLWHNS